MVFHAIKVVTTSIPHTRGSVEGTIDLSLAGLVNIKNKRLSPSSKTISHLCRNGVPAVKGRTNVCGGMTNCTNVIKLFKIN